MKIPYFPTLLLRNVFFVVFVTAFLIVINATAQNNCLHFDGQNDYINLGTQIGNGNIRTIEMWFRPETTIDANSDTDYTALIARNNMGENCEFAIFFSEGIGFDGRLAFTLNVTNGDYRTIYSDQNSWTANTWYHVAATVDGVAGMQMYINGVLQNQTNPYTNAPCTTGDITTLGTWGDANIRYFNGCMDEVRIWNTARAQAAIQADMNHELTGAETGLIAYYNFNEGIAGGNNGTVVNLPDLSSNSFGGSLINFTLAGQTSNWLCSDVWSPTECDTNNLCCSDFMQFCEKFDAGFYSNLDSCGVTIRAAALDSCHRVYYTFGDGSLAVGPVLGGANVSHAYSTPGNYTICALAQEINDAGEICWEKETCWEVCVDCDTCSTPAMKNLWATHFGGTGTDLAEGLEVDKDGNIYITGIFENSITIGSSPLSSTGGRDVYVAKFDKDKNPLWAFSFGGALDDIASDIDVDVYGNVYVVGWSFSSSVNFPMSSSNGTIGGSEIMNAISPSTGDAFMVKYEPNAITANVVDYDWSHSFGDIGRDKINAIEVTPAREIYITGTFGGNVEFDPIATTVTSSIRAEDAFIAKYKDANVGLDYEWVRHFGGQVSTGISPVNRGRDLAIDQSGNVYAIGELRGNSAVFSTNPNITLSSTFSSNGNYTYISKFNSNGVCQWAYALQSDARVTGYEVAVDDQYLYTVGILWNNTSSTDFNLSGAGGPSNLMCLSQGCAYIAKYDLTNPNADLDHQWSFLLATGDNDQGLEVAPTVNGDVVVSGYFSGFNVDFDPGNSVASFTSNGRDMFIAKYDAGGNYKMAITPGGTDNDGGKAMAIDYKGNIILAGNYLSNDLDPISTVDPTYSPGNNGSNDVFIGKYACKCPLEITCPADVCVTVEAGVDGIPVEFPVPDISGFCDRIIVCNPPSGSFFPCDTTLVTCTVIDTVTMDTASCHFKVVVKKDTVEICEADFGWIQLDCSNVQFNVSATGTGVSYCWNFDGGTDCDSNQPNPTYLFPSAGTYNVCVNVTYANGCTATQCHTVTVMPDTQPPTALCISSLNVLLGANCSAAISPNDVDDGSFDNCSDVTLSLDKSVFDQMDACQMVTVTLTVTDAAGNSSQCFANVNVLDNTAPVFTNCPASMTVQGVLDAMGNCTAAVALPAPAVMDNCMGFTLSYVLSGATLGSGTSVNTSEVLNMGTTTVTWTASDFCGNTSPVCIYTVTLSCTYAPCPNNIVLNGGFSLGAVPGNLGGPGNSNNWTALGTSTPQVINNDFCGDPFAIQMWGNRDLGESIQQAVNFQAGVTYSITFCASFLPVATATTPYVQIGFTASNGNIIPHNNPNAYNIGATPAAGNGTINSTAWACYSLPNWTPAQNFNLLTINAFNAVPNVPGGNTIVSWGKIDNVCISVVSTACQANFTWSEKGSPFCGVVQFTDISTSSLSTVTNWNWSIDGNPVSQAQNFTYTFPVSGSYNVCLDITDQSGCTSQNCQNITVNFADGPPIIQCPANQVYANNPGQCFSTMMAPAATVTGVNICDPAYELACNRSDNQALGAAFPVGTTMITCVASNIFGSSLCNFTVTVKDVESPLSPCPPDITQTVPQGASGAVVNFFLVNADNCPGTVSVVSQSPAPNQSGDFFPVGCTTIDLVATDASLNSTPCSFNVCIEEECNDCSTFTSDVDAGYHPPIITYGNPCIRTFIPKQLGPCDFVEWQLTTSGSTLTGNSFGNDPIVFTLMSGKVYKIRMIVTRNLLDGTVCQPNPYEFFDSYYIAACVPHSCVSSEVLLNGDFQNGLASWQVLTGNPVAETGMGCQDEGYVVLSGNMDASDMIAQDVSGLPSSDEKDFLISLCLRPGESPKPGTRLVVSTADDPMECLQPDGDCNVIGIIDIGDGGPDFPPQDPMFTKYMFNSLIFRIENDEADDDTPGSRSFVGIDNICIEVLDSVTAVKDLPFGGMGANIFPNPTSGEISIAFSAPLASDANLLVMDVVGRKVLSQQLSRNTSNQVLDLGHLPSAVYYVKMTNANGQVWNGRFVKQ